MITAVITLLLSASAEMRVDLETATLILDTAGHARIEMAGDVNPWPTTAQPVFQLDRKGEHVFPESVSLAGDRLTAHFPGGAACEFAVRAGGGFALFDLVRFEPVSPVERLGLFSVALPEGAEVMGTLNAAGTPSHMVALSAGEPNVHAFSRLSGRHEADRAGCAHEFALTDQVKAGLGAARFTASCNEQAGGWSVSSFPLRGPLDLTGLKALRLWVNGDGKGELLKIQFCDNAGGCRDAYIPITFEGWQQITTTDNSLDTLRYDHVTDFSIYYNGLPAGQTVTCILDQVEAVLDRDGSEKVLQIEDFEPRSVYWSDPTTTLNVETLSAHGLQPARFGLLACPREKFMETMQRFEEAAGLPSPKPGGVWNKQSPWIKRSYLFITSFKESQFDSVLSLARRGGFDMVLIGQESWARATGHYEINTDNFPGGIDALARTMRRFRQEGFHAGLHFLGPSIYPPDPYLAPVPDPRLVRNASGTLAADLDEKTDILPLEAAPKDFPAEDGGYEGDGAVVQIGDELISYAARSVEVPFGLSGCKRGILGTTAAPHSKGQPVRHLQRSYGYFLFDMDTTLLDEVSSNFARVANACDIDMIYFDGSERLQGDHWYYNARLHRAFFDKLARKDILMQASSYSHYSWHILARSASADGHGDLKGYLDERSAWLDAFRRDAMPLDIGWYYGYDTSCTPDMYEYVLGASIGYDSSISFQVSPAAASKHPFTGEILDLIARYEKLRLSGRVPDEMRARLRIDPPLAGQKTPEEREALADLRREYRLLNRDGVDVFQRVVYSPWHEIADAGPAVKLWQVHVKHGPAQVGVQVHAEPGPWHEAGTSYGSAHSVTIDSFDDLAPYLKTPKGQIGIVDVPNGESGATFPGVSQHISLSDEGTKAGGLCAVYSAESALSESNGWSVFGRRFDPPLDLSWHKAIGFWLRGDGKGGLFKLQLLDGAKAADYYIPNDYEGWRYQQLPRPTTDPIDYGRVGTLNFYYNGLPAKTTVTCAIDDVKALPAVDVQTLVDPWVEVAGHRFDWKGELAAGQYLFLWPGEPGRCYGSKFSEPVTGSEAALSFALPEGEHDVQFGCGGSVMLPVRVRVTLQPSEAHEIR